MARCQIGNDMRLPALFLGLAALAIGKVWESLKDKTGETLNEMGETVEAEFAARRDAVRRQAGA